MMYFGISPTAGAILALILIAWLIGAGVKSAGKNVSNSSVEPLSKEEWKKVKEELGPMTWEERIASAVIIIIFIAVVAGLAMIY